MIGCDMVSNQRVERLYKKFGKKFLHKFLCEEEISLFFKRQESIEFLASRWALKEALIKVLGYEFTKQIKQSQIKKGRLQHPFDFPLYASLSHEKDYSICVAFRPLAH